MFDYICKVRNLYGLAEVRIETALEEPLTVTWHS
jgi:hypothetical protein